jgi:hypothetical protein
VSTIPDWLIAALFIAAIVACFLIPDRHRPWWEKRREK